jgi:hypothetical protein
MKQMRRSTEATARAVTPATEVGAMLLDQPIPRAKPMSLPAQESFVSPRSTKVCVAQLGKRAEYFVPRLLEGAGMLSHLYTDTCAVGAWPRLLRVIPEQYRSRRLRQLMGRVPDGVPEESITAFNLFGLEYARRRSVARTPTEVTAAHLWAGEAFCRMVLRRGFKDATTLFTYTSAGLELMTAARRAGLRTVMEQIIAPRSVEISILQEEQERFPDWQTPDQDDDVRQVYIDREQAEWAAADVIVCGSEFVRDGIAACNGPVERCVVLPYGVELSLPYQDRERRDGPLRVLTIGAGLRKGTPYILDAAMRLKGIAEFRVIGDVGTAETIARVSEHLDVRGIVPRSDILQHFAWADVFLLPSLCEGSPLAIYEALNCGLPVICTPNTGSVVRDNLDGFIVPIRNSDAIVDRLERLASTPDLRREMSRNAYAQGRRFGPDVYKEKILSLF